MRTTHRGVVYLDVETTPLVLRVVDAAAAYGRAFPMMMPAAGTVSPAKVFVMGGWMTRKSPAEADQSLVSLGASLQFTFCDRLLIRACAGFIAVLHPLVSRFSLVRLDDGSWFCSVVRHFRLDRS